MIVIIVCANQTRVIPSNPPFKQLEHYILATKMATYGTIKEFEAENEKISSYLERVELYFAANEIANEKKVAILLSVIGAKTYGLIRDLLAPTNPKEKSFDQLAEVLKKHFEPKPLVIAERFTFHRRNQSPTESVLEYVAELRRLAVHCDFENYLDQALRDRLVCGLRSENTQKRLLCEANLTLARAVELAQGMEAAHQNTQFMKGKAEGTIGKVTHEQKSTSSSDKQEQSKKKKCYRCGKHGHAAADCTFKDSKCHKCGKKGHIAKVCHTKGVHLTQCIETDLPPSAHTEDVVFRLGNRASQPYQVVINVNDKPVIMEIDTGAAVSIMSSRSLKSLFPTATLQEAAVRLRTYMAREMPLLGQLSVNVRYGNYSGTHTLYVVKGNGPCLLGRDWLQHIQLDWAGIKAVYMTKGHTKLETLIQKYPKVFQSGLGTMKSFRAHLHLKEGAHPKFCRPRAVPFAIKECVGRELDRLEEAGIVIKENYSEWAAPIVPVPKQDGSIRVCGDFKVTINPFLNVDQYPLPKPSDLMTCLTGGKIFTKLDLTAAYQQMLLDDESSKLVVINTHQGLYRYTRLPFGVASAPAVFQRAMDSILQGMSHVICYIDDILVTGTTVAEHDSNLEEVLKRLQEHGIRLKQEKCSFFKDSVEYLGHRISANGVHTTKEKTQAIIEAPEPKNIQELRSFLGLLNYYAKFIPNLASLLYPLHELLRKDCRWHWTKKCSEVFVEAKKKMTSAPVLAHYDPSLPIVLAGDASAYGIGAVISHSFPDGSERPIAYASRSLSCPERNYAQVEKEALALIFGLSKFHQYLYGRTFILQTDHKPLTTILGPTQGIPSLAAARLQRWAIQLAGYSYQIRFRPTKQHCNADGLSRLPLKDKSPVGNPPDPTIFNVSQVETLPVTAKNCRLQPVLTQYLEKC